MTQIRTGPITGHSLGAAGDPPTVSTVDRPASADDPGAPAAGVGSPLDSFEDSPTEAQLDGVRDRQLAGYSWAADEVDAVMQRHAVGDARLLLRTAAAMDDGDRYLAPGELARAGDSLTRDAMRGYRWSTSALAELMTRTGLGSETALLAEARRQDDGDHVLSPAELEAAAAVVKHTVPANDVATIRARLAQLGDHPRVEKSEIGRASGQPLHALRIRPRDTSQPPKLKVLITAGVHGNEPCGPAATLLLIDQILGQSSFRDAIDFTIIPLINPRGLADNTRRTPEGDDLNRVMGADDAPDEAKLVAAHLRGRDFDLALDLHSGKAKRNGFWALHAGQADIFERAMERFDLRWPALHGDTSPYVMEHPGVGHSFNPATLKGLAKQLGARWAATLEAPGSVGYHDQVFGENELANLVIAEALTQRTLEDIA